MNHFEGPSTGAIESKAASPFAQLDRMRVTMRSILYLFALLCAASSPREHVKKNEMAIVRFVAKLLLIE